MAALSSAVTLRSASFKAKCFTCTQRERSSFSMRVSVPLRSSRQKVYCEAASFAKPETVEKVLDIVARQLSASSVNITSDSKFSDIGADSLDQVEIVMALEEEFNIEIEDGGAESIVTVQDAADLIQRAVSAKTSS
ncbi:hypothetical protein KP509_26G015200 [Ceratopteris richardii]|uniref:Acyl carrier protein n=1 Tax=Ceratopteris richardii TaxID=49495 RepID=A0A8T2RJX7_CERRI|nr:hypothetical protein KP509_26G015200 [Ceratopteris richardii]